LTSQEPKGSLSGSLDVRPALVDRAVGERVGFAVALARDVRDPGLRKAGDERLRLAVERLEAGVLDLVAALELATSSSESEKTSTVVAPFASAKRRPCRSAWYSATLLVAFPM
jgi:hypothetical protein